MKYFTKILLIVIILFQIPFINVNAEECSEEKISNLKEFSNAINMTSEFDKDSVVLGIYNNNIVTVQGLTEDLYVVSEDESVGIYYDDLFDGVAVEVVDSLTNKFYVYSYSCPGVVLRTINLSTKRYNIYADYEECDGIEEGELDVCDEFYDGDISYDEFIKKINDYKKKQAAISDIDNVVDNNYIYVIVGVVILLAVIVMIIIYRKKRNRLD